MSSYSIGIDVHKSTAQVAVKDEEGECIDQRRVPNEDLEAIENKYAGNEAALEAGSNSFTIYDRLSKRLDVTLVDPGQAPWLTRQKLKSDRKDAKNLARYLRLGEVPESYVPP